MKLCRCRGAFPVVTNHVTYAPVSHPHPPAASLLRPHLNLRAKIQKKQKPISAVCVTLPPLLCCRANGSLSMFSSDHCYGRGSQLIFPQLCHSRSSHTTIIAVTQTLIFGKNKRALRVTIPMSDHPMVSYSKYTHYNNATRD